MKLLFGADLHGCRDAAGRLVARFEKGQYDYLVLLGDLLNHGPRNPLPEHYDPMAVVELLNPLAASIIAVRGNCDSEVDQALLDFPLMADYNQLLLPGRRCFLSHGHLYGPDNLPPLAAEDLLCFGHIHLPVLERGPACWLFNPGSTTIPRGGHPSSFGEYLDGELSIRALHGGEIINQLRLV